MCSLLIPNIVLPSLRMDLDYIFWYNNLAKLIVTGLLPFVDVPETHFEIPMISSFKAMSLGELGLTKPPRTAFGNFVAAILDAILMRYVIKCGMGA